VESCCNPFNVPRVDPHTGTRLKGECNSENTKLLVDTSLIDPFNQKKDTVYRFIGEIEQSLGELLLKPRIVTNMDGLDLLLWMEMTKLARNKLCT
jgi:hypothetical protein